MKIFNNFIIPKKYKRSSLAVGNFDGVHKGHQKVFKYAKNKKSKFGNYKLTSEDEKFKLFKKYGAILW